MSRLKSLIDTLLPIAFALLVVVVLAAIVTFGSSSAEPETIEVSVKIDRYIDQEAGVVCWLYDGYNTGGISCLPLDDTDLDKG